MKLMPEVFLKSSNEMSPDFEINEDLNSWVDDYDGMTYDDLQSKYKNNRHFSHLAKADRDDARRDYHTKLRSRYRQAMVFKHFFLICSFRKCRELYHRLYNKLYKLSRILKVVHLIKKHKNF